MAETPSIPPAQPATPLSGNTPVTPVSPPTAPQLTLTEVPVRRAPLELVQAALLKVMEGTVISASPQAQEVSIQTAAGVVDIKTAVQFLPGTEVTIKVYMDKLKTLADIIVLRQTAVQPQQEEKPVPPPPPPPALKEGQTVAAILLPGKTPVQTDIVSDTSKYHHPNLLPLRPGEEEGAGTINDRSNLPEKKTAQTEPIPSAPQKNFTVQIPVSNRAEPPVQPLPPELDKAEKPAHFLPAAVKRVLAAYLPQLWGKAPEIPEAPIPETVDSNLLQIMNAQLHARKTLQTMQSPAPDPLPSPEMQTTASSRPAVSFLPQNADATENLFLLNAAPLPPASAMVEKILFQAAAPLPKNMYQLVVIKVFPPETPPEKINAAVLKLAESPRPVPLQRAEVESITPSGFPILKTADSHFVIKSPVRAPVGSIVIFEARPMTPEQIIASAKPQAAEETLLLKNRAAPEFEPLQNTAWPALQEALQALQQADPPTAQVFRHSLPTPTQHLAPAALFFLAALRLGALENWLGDNTLKALKAAGKNDLLERLDSDFSKISAQADKPLPDAWRSVSIPLLHDDQLSQMQFLVRLQGDQGGREAGKNPATRFILNLHLSRMGEMQLDGFIQKKHFDIILRTEEKLPFSMRQDLMQGFARGLDQVQMQGGITFQTRQQAWVTVELPQQSGTFI
jgi:hypothetical protein